MKKAEKLFLGIAAAAIALGLILGGISAAFIADRVRTGETIFPGGNNSPKYVRTEKTFDPGAVERLTVDTQYNALRLERSGDGMIHVSSCSAEDGERCVVELRGGSLSVSIDDSHVPALNWFNCDTTDRTIILSVPEDCVLPADLRVSSGSFRSENVSFGELSVFDQSGSCSISGGAADSLTLSAESGAVKIGDFNTAGSLAVTAESGSVKLENVDCIGELTVKAESGSVKLGAVTADKLTVGSSSGSIHFDGTSAASISAIASSGSVYFTDSSARLLDLKSSSGSIKLENAVGDDITLSASSGSVRGTIVGSEDDYSVIANAGSGSSSLESRIGGKKSLKVTTGSGSIKLDFIDAPAE